MLFSVLGSAQPVASARTDTSHRSASATSQIMRAAAAISSGSLSSAASSAVHQVSGGGGDCAQVAVTDHVHGSSGSSSRFNLRLQRARRGQNAGSLQASDRSSLRGDCSIKASPVCTGTPAAPRPVPLPPRSEVFRASSNPIVSSNPANQILSLYIYIQYTHAQYQHGVVSSYSQFNIRERSQCLGWLARLTKD
jgi:hypothetical protein